MIGRAGSQGLPGKNTKKIFGKSLCEYPLIASKKSKYIEKIFVSTDCPKIKKVSKKYNVDFVARPKRLSNSKALGDHVFEHTYKEIKKKLKIKRKKIKYVILLFANAPLVTAKMIDNGI